MRLSAVVADLVISTSQPLSSQNVLLPGSLNVTTQILQDIVDVLLNTADDGSNFAHITNTLVSIFISL